MITVLEHNSLSVLFQILCSLVFGSQLNTNEQRSTYCKLLVEKRTPSVATDWLVLVHASVVQVSDETATMKYTCCMISISKYQIN